MMRRLAAAILLTMAFAWPAEAAGYRSTNWAHFWPPEPYLSQAIAAIEAGDIHWMWAEQSTIDAMASYGALGITFETNGHPFTFISLDNSPQSACRVLIHEAAHQLGWAADHTGGGWGPQRGCPLPEEFWPQR